MPDDMDKRIPPNTREMLDQSTKEGTDRSRRISSLTSKVSAMEQQTKVDIKKMSDEISKISKKQRQVREDMKDVKDSSVPEIEAMAPEVNKILTGISGAVGSLAVGMKRITLDTASSAKNVVGQYGKAISEDISINRENMLAMSLAKSTPIFGYFAAKFMQTDVFKNTAAKIKSTLISAVSSVGGGLKSVASGALSKIKGFVPGKVKEEVPKMASGGYVQSGGLAEVHPAEVVGPIDKILANVSGSSKKREQVEEQTLTTLQDLSTNMKTYGSYFQKEKMNRKGIIGDFVQGLWRGKYGKSWEFRMLIATERLSEAISGIPNKFKYAWETIIWKHPIFRKLLGSMRLIGRFSGAMVKGVMGTAKGILGMGGKYAKDMSKSAKQKTGFAQIADILATFYTTLMPKIDTLIRNSGALVNFALQEAGYEEQLKDTSRFKRGVSKVWQALPLTKKKKELTMGIPEEGGEPARLTAGNRTEIQLLEEIAHNTSVFSYMGKRIANQQGYLLLEQKKTRKNVRTVGTKISGLKKSFKSAGSFLWKLIMMGWSMIGNIAKDITKYLPLIAIGLGKATLVGAAGLAGYAFGEWLNKKIDDAFGEKGGLGKWIYDKTHKYGRKWYQVAWGFANLPLEISTSLQEKTKSTVYEKVEEAYDKYTPGWIKTGVSMVTAPFKKAKEFREKTEATISEKAKTAYDEYAPDTVKSVLNFMTAPFKGVNKWLTEDTKAIEKKAEKVREETATPVTDKVVGFAKSAYKQVKKVDEAWDQMGVNLTGMYNETKNTIVSIINLPGKIVDLVKWPFQKVSSLIFNIKQWSLQALRSIPIIGKWIDGTDDDSWLKKDKLNAELEKDKAWKARIDGIKKIADLITWPIKKMVELVGHAKNWTMAKLKKVPIIGSLLKWIGSKEEKEEEKETQTPSKSTVSNISSPAASTRKKRFTSWERDKLEMRQRRDVMRVLGASNMTMRNGIPHMIKVDGKWREATIADLDKTEDAMNAVTAKYRKKYTNMAKGGITTEAGIARLHASEAVIPIPPKLAEALTGSVIDRSQIAKSSVASKMAEGRFAAGELGKKTKDIAGQIDKGQTQINNALVYTSNLMANSNSSVASTIADSMKSGSGGFSSGNDFAAQVLKCDLS